MISDGTATEDDLLLMAAAVDNGSEQESQSSEQTSESEEESEDQSEEETEIETEIPDGSASIISRVEDDTETIEETEDIKSFKNDGVPVNAAEASEMVKNAIQKAVDAVWETITTTVKSVTIEVEDGDYRGDIDLAPSVSRLGNIAGDFVLNIIAKSSTRKTNADGTLDLKDNSVQAEADAGSGVKISGNIIIDGIRVLLSGLTMDSDHKITVTDGHLDLLGTSEGDAVQVELGKGGSADVVTGKGGDNVHIASQIGAGDVDVNTGEGDDEITLTGTGKSYTNPDTSQADIHTGEGNDRVNIDASAADVYDTVTLDGEEGKDRLHLTGRLYSSKDNENIDPIGGDERR